MEDITTSLQQTISGASSKTSDLSQFTQIQIPKGDYYIQLLTIPKNRRNGCAFSMLEREIGPCLSWKRARSLILGEKLELYYNTNNVQEAAKLMIRSPASSRAEISKEVKLSLFSQK